MIVNNKCARVSVAFFKLKSLRFHNYKRLNIFSDILIKFINFEFILLQRNICYKIDLFIKK